MAPGQVGQEPDGGRRSEAAFPENPGGLFRLYNNTVITKLIIMIITTRMTTNV